jgi:O-methyltransferase involved in polyketide biosynthesis
VSSSAGDEKSPFPDLMTDQAHSARMYDYFLGGKDNYPVDREMGDAAEAAFPGIRIAARANRAFLQRVGTFVAEQGIRQFLDVGTGIPTAPNLHQIVQAVEPSARVVYVDNDPLVLAHAAALMVSDPRGSTTFIQADAHNPEQILAAPHLRESLDLDQPAALSLVAVLHFLDDDAAAALVRTLTAAVPSGSYLWLTHSTLDLDADGAVTAAVARYHAAGVMSYMRTHEQVTRLFLGGLDVLEPGLVPTHHWPSLENIANAPSDSDVSAYAVVARKP